MADLIDRQALLERLCVENCNHIYDGKCNNCYFSAFLEGLPAIEAEPVRHGRWDAIPNTYMSVATKDGSYSGNVTSCSVRHEVNPNAYKTNYCPNCGAKMDGGTE